MSFFVILLIFAISSGQLIKIPVFNQSGLTFLDLTVLVLSIYGLWTLKLKLPKPPLFIKLSLVFALTAIISLVLTPLQLSNFEFLVSSSYIIRFLLYILFGWVIYANAFPQISQNLNKIFIFSGLILALMGIIQITFFPNLDFLTANGWDPHFFRTVSTFLDPNFLGGFLVISLVLLLQKIDWFISKRMQTFTFLVIYLCLVFTFSRSSALMLLVSFLVFAVLKKSFKYAVLAVLLFGIMLGVFMVYQNIIATPRNIDRTQSAQYRLNSYEQGIDLFTKSPIFGIGFNAYRFGLEQYSLADKQLIQSRGAASNDASLLFVLSTTGIVGFIIYLSFLGSILYQSWNRFKTGNQLGIVVISIIGGLLVQGLFTNSLFYPFILVAIILYSSKLYKS